MLEEAIPKVAVVYAIISKLMTQAEDLVILQLFVPQRRLIRVALFGDFSVSAGMKLNVLYLLQEPESLKVVDV